MNINCLNRTILELPKDVAMEYEPLLYTVFASVDEAVHKLKLDRRIKWYYFKGSLIRDIKFKAPCWDCGGDGCQTCGYKKNTWQYAPEYAIDNRNGNPVIILNGG